MNKTGDTAQNEELFSGTKDAANTDGRVTPKERIKPSMTPILSDPRLYDFKTESQEFRKLKFGIKPWAINTEKMAFRDIVNATPLLLPSTFIKDSLSP